MRINPISANYVNVSSKNESYIIKTFENVSFSGKDMFVKSAGKKEISMRTKKILAGARNGFKDMSFVNYALGGLTIASIPITAALHGAVDWLAVSAIASCFGFTSLLGIIGGIDDAKKSIKKLDELKKSTKF